MGRNIIFVFTGTGNSLWAAKEIGKELDDCEIAAIGGEEAFSLSGPYDRIGFIYPTYAGGMPRCVKEFVQQLNFMNNQNTYYFAVATCGRVAKAQNVIIQMGRLLKRKGVELHYGERLDMFSNYVVGYEMRDTAEEEAKQSAEDLKPMIDNIKNKRRNKIRLLPTPRQVESMGFMFIVHKMDKNFCISDDCIKCGICKKVCPVNNIEMDKNEKPCYKHRCEQCLACIQNCPVKAINYKDKTQNRKRYVHPDISWKELAALKGYDVHKG